MIPLKMEIRTTIYRSLYGSPLNTLAWCSNRADGYHPPIEVSAQSFEVGALGVVFGIAANMP